MSIKDKLKIYLITYNRKDTLIRTFEQIFANNSPIKDFDITILNNHSDDGTDDVIKVYQDKFPNIEHIKHSVNIGGNANICRAFELSASCGYEYAWILCDDDIMDFSAWDELEMCINQKKDLICVSDYSFPNEKSKKNLANQIFQLAFVPANIFKTEYITDSIVSSMYECIYTMFPQTCLSTYLINNNKDICVLKKGIVINGCCYGLDHKDSSYTRGMQLDTIIERKSITNWILGYSNIITLLMDKHLAKNCIEAAIPYKDIYGSWTKFYEDLFVRYFNFVYFNYFYEIFKTLYKKRKLEFLNFVFLEYQKKIKSRLKILKISKIIKIYILLNR